MDDFVTGFGFAVSVASSAQLMWSAIKGSSATLNAIKGSDTEWQKFNSFIRKIIKKVGTDYKNSPDVSPDHRDIFSANDYEDLLYSNVVEALTTNQPFNVSMVLPSESNFPVSEKHRLYCLLKAELETSFEYVMRTGQTEILEQIQELYHYADSLNTELKSISTTTLDTNAMVKEMHNELIKNPKEYKQLTDSTKTPFSDSVTMEDDWKRYGAYLNQQTQESVFGESFSLSQIYIPLCAYYEEKENKKSIGKRIVVDLQDAVREWLNKDDKNDSVRIISGGPGSGKSSFAKMFAAKIVNTHKVLFIPLHNLSLDLGINIKESIYEFLTGNKFFDDTPIGKGEKLLIVFDGLDELSLQGKIGVEAACYFITQVKQLLANHNNQKLQLHVIITSRDVPAYAIEADFKKNGQVLHVLPYYVNGKERSLYSDEKKLLSEDKRNLWWETYGMLTGKNYKKLPDELKRDTLIEITAQPLLNYLLALSYGRGKIKFSDKTSRNELYSDLINAVYERGWQGEHPATQDIKEHEFEQVLEEIAVSAWQGAGLTTTLEAIRKRCEKNNIVKILPEFRECAEKGVLNLLTAFYFRQYGETTEGDKTFEFTHKSFGEYLTAKKIVRQLQKTKEKIEQQKTKVDGWTLKEALVNWIELCGNVPLDEDIHKFLCDEIPRYEKSKVESWQVMLCELISYMLKHGMPFEEISPRSKYIDETRMSRNAEETLLAALSACSRFTNKISNIEWEKKESAGEWFSKLCGQRTRTEYSTFAYSCLNNIDLSKRVLRLKDFWGADLSGADLSGADLSGADLRKVDLSRANLSRVNLDRAHLSGVDLNRANLSGAKLNRANLSGAKLNRANLSEAKLNEAHLIGTDLSEAKLIGAKLSRADLIGTDLRGANLSNADLRGANLRNAINLFDAKLQNTILQKGDLNESDLQKALDLGVIVRDL